MDSFNHIITSIFDALCAPFASLHPAWGLSALSVLTGVAMLIIFRFTSNQEGIRRIKNRIKAYFLEARLYNDDLGLVFAAQKNILKNTLAYMRYSLTPMLFLIIPVVLIMIQLSLWFDRHPLHAGDSAMVTVTYGDHESFNEGVVLHAPEGIEIETPPVRIPEKREVVWRVKARENGSFDLTFSNNPDVVTKRVTVSDGLKRLSVRRVAPGLYQQLLHPAETSIPPATGIESIEISYPFITYSFLGWSIHWLVIFFVVSIAAGFLLKGIFGVEV